MTSDSGGGDTAKRRISDGLSVLSEGLRSLLGIRGVHLRLK